MYRSLPSVIEDRKSWGCGLMYPDYTAPPTTATRNGNPLQCSSVSCVVEVEVEVVLAAASVRFIGDNACLLSPFTYLCTAPSLLFGRSCRDCFWSFLSGMLLPIPFKTLGVTAATVSLISTASRERSSSDTAVSRRFLIPFMFACTHSTVYLSTHSTAVSARYFVPDKGQKKTPRGPKSSGISSATPTANQAAVRAVAPCCRLLAYTTHTVMLCVCCGTKVALPALLRTKSFFFFN